MIQPVQKLYAMRRATDILYHDLRTRKMVSASEAILGGAYRDSQVYVRYETGLEVWVNGSLKESWKLDAAGKTWVSYNDPQWLAARHRLGDGFKPILDMMLAATAEVANQAAGTE